MFSRSHTRTTWLILLAAALAFPGSATRDQSGDCHLPAHAQVEEVSIERDAEAVFGYLRSSLPAMTTLPVCLFAAAADRPSRVALRLRTGEALFGRGVPQ